VKDWWQADHVDARREDDVTTHEVETAAAVAVLRVA
jgi:hypothetical protein